MYYIFSFQTILSQLYLEIILELKINNRFGHKILLGLILILNKLMIIIRFEPTFRMIFLSHENQ